MRNFVGLAAMPEIAYHRPKTLEEALQLLNTYKGNGKIIAGGTDLVVALRTKKLELPQDHPIIDISSIEELQCITEDNELLHIGATTKLAEIALSSIIRKDARILADAVAKIGSLQIRMLGTLGGNLCNASPAADTAPPLSVLNATVIIRNITKTRLVPIRDFFLGPGKTMLESGDIVTGVQIPILEGGVDSCFLKLGRRNAFTLSTVSVATLIKVRNGIFQDVRIALGAVAPTPIRILEAENYLIGKQIDEQIIEKGAEVVASEVKPISDVRATSSYRRDMSYVLTKRAIMSCLGKNVTVAPT